MPARLAALRPWLRPQPSLPRHDPGFRRRPCLFLVVLGGRTDRSLIELHDVRFVAGRRIEDTFPALRRQWFGRREDCTSMPTCR